MLRCRRPLSSIATNFTVTKSPSFTTSLGLSTRSSLISLTCTRPSLPGKYLNERAKVHDADNWYVGVDCADFRLYGNVADPS